MNPNPNASPSVTTYSFDLELGRKKLAQMIILHEYPLSMVEHSGFIDYSNTLCPMFKMLSRNTIRSDILKMYKVEKEKCSQNLEKNRSRIAITTDMWTANHQKRGYMTVTAHFIDDSWKLHSRIISFKYVPCPHDAVTLTDTLSSCLSEWNIEDKISTVTVDNCTTNDAMIPLLKEKFNSNCFILKGKLLHMCCCAHILNLIVKDGLPVIGDSIDKIRDSVAYWSGTPKRYEKFEDTARSLEVTCTTKLSVDCQRRWNSTTKLSVDCQRRWNSTYLMLNIALLYNRVRKLCYELLEEYSFKFPNLRERSQQMDSVSASSQTQIDDLSNFDTYVRVAYGVENVKSELELYLEEKLIPRTDEFFDICNYWKVTGLKYPVLNMIAKDIFVVPISTIASESTFSTVCRHVGSH
ncbi:zinc finger BED domain-containing protein RICESLEEPER 2-like [Humulus lupulus]|uniref:zinc finger BED domain-containing protein RICESLEEPER 2-like n=1 Tax=Humulus lupulus TaxID=3486 RepID=UPI002B40C02D|nr:zinc finger BED domain-containing protein RICESLEEPER 2-like [Humulus lupulus]